MEPIKVGCLAAETVGGNDTPVRCCWNSVYQQPANISLASPSIEGRLSSFPVSISFSNSGSIPCPSSSSSADAGVARNLIHCSCSTVERMEEKTEPNSNVYICPSCRCFAAIPLLGHTCEFGSTTKKFQPTVKDDKMTKEILSILKPRYQSISVMPEYENKSFEELRLEDYLANRISFPPKSDLSPTNADSLIESLIRCTDTYHKRSLISKNSIKEDSTSLLEVLLNTIRSRMDIRFLSDETKITCDKLTNKLMDFTEKTVENLTVVILEDILHRLKNKRKSYNQCIKKSSRIDEQKKQISRNHKKIRNARKLYRKISKGDQRQPSFVKYGSTTFGGTLSYTSSPLSSSEDHGAEKSDFFHTLGACKKMGRKYRRKYGHDCNKFEDYCEACTNNELKWVQKTKIKPAPLSKYRTNKSSTKCSTHRRRANEQCLKSNLGSKIRGREDERHVYELLKSITVDDKTRTLNRKQQKTESEKSNVTSEESDDSSASELSIFPKERVNSNLDENNDYSEASSSV